MDGDVGMRKKSGAEAGGCWERELEKGRMLGEKQGLPWKKLGCWRKHRERERERGGWLEEAESDNRGCAEGRGSVGEAQQGLAALLGRCREWRLRVLFW